MIPPFYVGQEIVAIRDHSQGYFKKGQEFIVQSIQKSCCSWVISIGITTKCSRSRCPRCERREEIKDGIARFKTESFAPKEPFKKVTFSHIIKQEPVSSN